MKDLDKFPLSVDLKITASDILNGEFESNVHCPVAIAANWEFGCGVREYVSGLVIINRYGDTIARYEHADYTHTQYHYDEKIAQHMPPEQVMRMIVLTRIN